MTPRLILLWLRLGAQAFMAALGGLFALILIVLALLYFHPVSIYPTPLHAVAVIVLAHAAAICAGGFILVTAAFVLIDSLLAAFHAEPE